MKPGSLLPFMVLLALQILKSWAVEDPSKGELECLWTYPGTRGPDGSAGWYLLLSPGADLEVTFRMVWPMALNFRHLSEDFS